MHFDSSPEKWQSSFDVDVMGFVNLVEAAVPWLEKAPHPSIIVQSSFMGREFFRSPPAPYGPCKAAQMQHVQELSHFLGPKGVRVNAISPGPTWSKDGAWETYSKIAPEWVEEQRLKVPLKRFGTPEDIANVAVFLASPLSSWVQGANWLVDGGIHIGTSF
jgi:NAD(P)-dependent dehydrogenase (short-subunit alcohol dehydrogenase family)